MKAASRTKSVTGKRSRADVGGAHAKSSAASVKVHNNHPLSGIVSGSRVRKQNSRYQ
jgi:hypothetical protein